MAVWSHAHLLKLSHHNGVLDHILYLFFIRYENLTTKDHREAGGNHLSTVHVHDTEELNDQC